MIVPAVVLLLSVTASLVSCGGGPTVHLPSDADYMVIVGDGFKLKVEKLNEIKDKWNNVADESNKVVEPRRGKSSHSPVVNKNLFQQIKDNVGQQQLGPMNKDLQEWISARATALNDKVERYENEVANLKNQQRIVVQVLLLNTLVDLENLVKEDIKSLRWVKRKLNAYKEIKETHAASVEQYIQSKINDNLKIEKSVRGTNNPGDKWLTNTKSIKRILLEQRFSELISKSAVEYLGGSFAMMERSRVFDLFVKSKKIDDGFFYQGSVGKIPAHFPFSAQDAIVNEA